MKASYLAVELQNVQTHRTANVVPKNAPPDMEGGKFPQLCQKMQLQRSFRAPNRGLWNTPLLMIIPFHGKTHPTSAFCGLWTEYTFDGSLFGGRHSGSLDLPLLIFMYHYHCSTKPTLSIQW